MFNELERLAVGPDGIFQNVEPGALNRGVSALEFVGQLATQNDPNISRFRDLSEGSIGSIVRTLGERGALAEGDVTRALGLLPRVFGDLGLPDTRKQATEKLKTLRGILERGVRKLHGTAAQPRVFNGPIVPPKNQRRPGDILNRNGATFQWDGVAWRTCRVMPSFTDEELGLTVQKDAAPMEPVPIPDASAFMDTPPRGERARELMMDLLPIAGATALSFAVPPLAPGLAAARVAPLLARLGMSIGGLLGLGARGATRFGPTVTAGGAGGAAGGATQAAIRGENIGEAALQSGAEMAAGEALGLGGVAGAARIAAPALGVITQQGCRALDFARKTPLPGSARGITGNPRALPISPEQVAPGLPQRAVQGLVDNLLPARLVAQERRRAVEEKLQVRADPEELQVVGFYASRDRLATIPAEIGRMAAKRVPHHPPRH